MKTQCPSCGAEIEFRYDDSFVRVCGNCRNAVVRTDRGVDSLGKVADLVPMDSPLRLFADGQLGSQTFILVGMAQLRHAAGGITQESPACCEICTRAVGDSAPVSEAQSSRR